MQLSGEADDSQSNCHQCCTCHVWRAVPGCSIIWLEALGALGSLLDCCEKQGHVPACTGICCMGMSRIDNYKGFACHDLLMILKHSQIASL